MATVSEQLHLAWRALSGDSTGDGWRTIPVHRGPHCMIAAGRCFPGNNPALVLGFGEARLPPGEQLPVGHGFELLRMPAGLEGLTRIAVVRLPAGNPELFETMAEDLCQVVIEHPGAASIQLLRVVIDRIRAWQDFMRKDRRKLSAEAEVGLLGELLVFRALLDEGVAPATVVSAWKGPEDGVHDFLVTGGAIEVKASVAGDAFLARVGSLEQLDDGGHPPLLVAAVRLVETAAGSTLPDFADETADLLKNDVVTEAQFGNLLIAAGLLSHHRLEYLRRFTLASLRLYEVTGVFPRLVLGNVPQGIVKASYEINLDAIAQPTLVLRDSLVRIGVL